MYTCLFCGAPDRSPEKKFCNECGSNWQPFEPGLNEPVALRRYKVQLQELLFVDPEADHSSSFDELRKRLKIDFAAHRELHEKIRGKLAMAQHLQAFRLEFDENVQESYAGHDTRLSFRFSNLSATERFFKVRLFWDDKETNDEMDFRAENNATVKPRETIPLGSTHVFMRPGYKEIKGLEITIENVIGEVATFRAETFHLRVGNPEQHISKSVTNNITGRVLSIDMAADAGARTDAGEDKGPLWRNLSFALIPAEDDEIERPDAARKPVTDTAPQPKVAPLSESPLTTVALAHPEVVAPEPGPLSKSVSAEAAVTTPAQVSDTSAAMDMRAALEKLLELLVKFSDMASSSSSKGAFWAMDFSLHLLEILYGETPDLEMDAIVGMVFENPAGVVRDNEQFIINYADDACVITLSGLTIVGKDGNTVISHASYSWGQIAANGWGLYRQRFGPGAYLISIGDPSAHQNFSGLRFDLRRYRGAESVEALYSEAQAVLGRIFELAPAYGGDDGNAPNSAHTNDGLIGGDDRMGEDDDGDEEHDKGLDSEGDEQHALRIQQFEERENRLGQFLKQYAFVMQRCDETRPRSVFIAPEMTPEL